jgi:hypothetical protein
VKSLRHPILTNASDNAKRRALLFIRHLSLWKEIPAGTEWYEVEINEQDLGQIRAFPRAQWRNSRGVISRSPRLPKACARVKHLVDAPFLSKMHRLAINFSWRIPDSVAVILIGLNESEPLTVLDGNHRLVAAMLASPSSLKKLRFHCAGYRLA